MNLDRKSISTGLTTVTLIALTALPSHVLVASDGSVSTGWTIQVDKIAPGDVNIAPSFRIAIYENLLQELGKTKQFKQVMRSGDRSANNVPDLLILKTTVESFTEGSETRRAVTTFGGATKLKVHSELYTRDGRKVLERDLKGNVRFFGDNLRATHNLAHNVAKVIKQSALPESPHSASDNTQHNSPVQSSRAANASSPYDLPMPLRTFL